VGDVGAAGPEEEGGVGVINCSGPFPLSPNGIGFGSAWEGNTRLPVEPPGVGTVAPPISDSSLEVQAHRFGCLVLTYCSYHFLVPTDSCNSFAVKFSRCIIHIQHQLVSYTFLSVVRVDKVLMYEKLIFVQ
jgi:hypothetical protein